MEHRSFQFHSSVIHYRVAGRGRPVILLHGFGEDGDIWEEQVSFLEKNYRLIIPDLPGSGASDRIADMSMEGMARMVKAIIDLETGVTNTPGKERISMLGHSMGGYVTLAVADLYPDLLYSFGLVHSTAYADNAEKIVARKRSIEFIHLHGAHAFLKTSLPGLFYREGLNDKPERRSLELKMAGLIEKSGRFLPETLVKYYQAMIDRPDRTRVLRSFKGPVLFLIGEKDNAIPFMDSLQQCHIPDHSHICVLQHSAHMGMLEEPVRVNRALGDFLE
jgi:pimeloyl-ACP methyl ester carboxylesterase